MDNYFIIGFLIVFFSLFIAIVIISKKRQNKIMNEGLDAQGEVYTKVEESMDSDGMIYSTTKYYCKYRTYQGEEVDAIIGNPNRKLKDGDQIFIKYLEEKPGYVCYVSKVGEE